jgi:leucine dehydrogenase
MTRSEPQRPGSRGAGPKAPNPDTEQLTVCRDRESGLVAVIAIDDTTLGPAIGGIRLRPYASEEAAIVECRRLGRAMSLKNALAGITFGGGKSVIIADGLIDRHEALLAFGRFVARTGGAYLPAADMGTGPEELRIVRETAGRIVDVETSEATAVGVHAAITQGVRAAGIASTLDGVSVVVQGAGHVGARLAELLAADGAHVGVSDADPGRASAVARSVSGTVVPVDEATIADCDVLAPCAIPNVVDERTVPLIRARLVAGAANDVLAEPAMAEALADRGVVHVPDFLANAGGVIAFQGSHDGWSPERLRDELAAIGTRAADVLDEAGTRGVTPVQVAEETAYAVLGRRRPAHPTSTQENA